MSDNDSPITVIPLIVENLPDERFVEGIFKPEIEAGLVSVHARYTASGAVSLAQSSLLEHPDRPIAVILNTGTDDPNEIEQEYRGPVQRILSRTAGRSWHAAFAIPGLDVWAAADPRIREALERDEAEHGKSTCAERSRRFEELVKEQPFDREALCRANDEARGLIEFIERTCAQMHSAAAAT